MFCYENGLVYPVYKSDQDFKELVMKVTHEDESNYVYNKDINRFMCSKIKCNTKKNLFENKL